MLYSFRFSSSSKLLLDDYDDGLWQMAQVFFSSLSPLVLSMLVFSFSLSEQSKIVFGGAYARIRTGGLSGLRSYVFPPCGFVSPSAAHKLVLLSSFSASVLFLMGSILFASKVLQSFLCGILPLLFYFALGSSIIHFLCALLWWVCSLRNEDMIMVLTFGMCFELWRVCYSVHRVPSAYFLTASAKQFGDEVILIFGGCSGKDCGWVFNVIGQKTSIGWA